MRRKYDIVVIGAGPAGSMLAGDLAVRGVDVLLAEKHRLPRYKPCGGGLTRRSLDLLPFITNDILEDRVYTARLHLNGTTISEERTSDPMIGMVMRDTFDHYMARRAVDAGAVLKEESVFLSCTGPANDLTVELSDGTVRTKIVAGADGVGSRVAKSMGLLRQRDYMVALEGELYFKNSKTLDRFRNTADFDFGVVPGGYGWVFPKAKNISIGVLSTARKVKRLKSHFDSYIRMKDLADGAELRSLKGHPIPVGPLKNARYANAMGLLLGDAAGITDPVTGEGIYFALRQAQLASKAVLRKLQDPHSDMSDYEEDVRLEFNKEFTYASRLGGLFYNYPTFGYMALRMVGPELTGHLLEIIVGKRSYKSLYAKVYQLHKLVLYLLNVYKKS